MAEYDRSPRNQLCTIITNGNIGSKQLKGFVDKRCTTQKVANQIKVIQKATIEDWCKGVNQTPDPTIALYSHIYSDGMGDAGLLGSLVDKVSTLRNPNSIISYATYNDPPHKPPVNKQDILDLSRINKPSYLRKVDEQHKRESGWVEYDKDKTWEIQYPFAARNIKMGDERILRVSEMNFLHQIIESDGVRLDNQMYHTGITNADKGMGIGYGIPKYDSNQDEEDLKQRLNTYNIHPEILPDSTAKYSYSCLKDAWLVKVNEGQSVTDILKKAKCPLLILLGKLDQQQESEFSTAPKTNPTLIHIDYLKQSLLSCLMSKIGCDGGKGMIFAGGEGMYVQALGASSAAVGDIIRDGYNYQTNQILSDSKKRKLDLNPDIINIIKSIDSLKVNLDELSKNINNLKPVPAEYIEYIALDNPDDIETILTKTLSSLTKTSSLLSRFTIEPDAINFSEEIDKKSDRINTNSSIIKTTLLASITSINPILVQIKAALAVLIQNVSNLTEMNFNPAESLGMMDIPQQELKAHSDWVRQPEHNWFNRLNALKPESTLPTDSIV